MNVGGDMATHCEGKCSWSRELQVDGLSLPSID